MDLSIVIPTFNSSRTISQCLSSVNSQTIPFKEVIVVDRYSTDRTGKVAREANANVIQSESNRSVARNLGFARSTSHGVIFIDSDMVLPNTLAEECLDGLQHNDAIVIPEVSFGEGFWASCKRLERGTHNGIGLLEAARCFRRRAFDLIGGYDPDLEAGEDWNLQYKATLRGLSIGRTVSRIMHDEGNMVLVTSLKKKYRYGKVIHRYLGSNLVRGIRQLNPVTRIASPALRILPQDPVHGMGILVLKTLEFSAAGIGYTMRSIDEVRR